MNTYKLNNIDLGSFGFIAGKQNESNIALTGGFDVPARIGKTFHSWGDEYSIEPYVFATEINYGERSISLVGYVYGNGKMDCRNKANRIFELIDRFSGLVSLSCKWGTYEVHINQSVTGAFIGDIALRMTFNFFEPVVFIEDRKIPRTNAEYGIDGISFKDLGATLLRSTGNRTSRPIPKTLGFTSQEDGLGLAKTEVGKLP